MVETVEQALIRRGGQLDLASVPGAGGSHLRFAADALRLQVTPVTVPAGPGSPLTATTPPSRVSQIAFVQRWGVNAFAILAEERPIIVFHAGVPFSLFELFSALLASPQVLPDVCADSERPQNAVPLPASDYSHILTTDYPHLIPLPAKQILAKDSKSDSEALPTRQLVDWSYYVPCKPIGRERTRLAYILYINALNFLFAHELGHIDNGHVQLLGKRHGSFGLSELSSVAERRQRAVAPRVRVALELDADAYALRRTFAPYLTGGDLFELPGLGDGLADNLRMLTVSIGVLFLWFERQTPAVSWWNRLWRRSMNTHPSNAARLLNVATVLSMMADPLGADVRTSSHQGITQGLSDLAAMAAVLRVGESFHRSWQTAGAELQEIVTLQSALAPELTACRAAVAERYFLHGRPITKKAYYSDAKPDNHFGLRGQSLRFRLDDEEVDIPFLDLSDGPEAMLDNANKWERVGFLDNSMMYATLALELQPGWTEAQAFLVDLRSRLGTLTRLVDSHISRHGLRTHFADELAKELAHEQNAAAIEELLDCLVTLRPREGAMRWRRAALKFTQRRFSEAAKDYELAIQLGLGREHYIDALVSLGTCFADDGNVEAGLKYYDQAVAHDPTSRYALLNQGIALVRLSRAAEGVAALEKATGLYPQDAGLWCTLAKAHKAVGNIASVRECTAKAIELDPVNPEFRLIQASLHREAREHLAEASALTSALELGADPASTRYQRGCAFGRAGKLEEATLDFEAVAARDSEWRTAAQTLLTKLREIRPQSEG